MYKHFRWFTLLLVLAIMAGACTQPTTPPPPAETEAPPPAETEAPPAPAEPFRVAVVMPSATNDLAFSQSMFDALTAIQNEMGAGNFEFAYSEGTFVVD